MTVAPLVPLKVNVAVLLAQTGLLLAEMEPVKDETVNKVLGPAPVALLPPPSVAVLGAMLIPNVPVPEIPLKVTVRVLVPEPATATVAVAVPAMLRVTLAGANVIVEAPV